MSERRDVIERLREVLYELTDSVSSHAMLSKICGAVYPDTASWDLFACEALGGEIIRLLDDADAEVDAVRSECSEMLDRIASDSVPLPRDANGAVIHVGDLVTGDNKLFRKYAPLSVDCFSYGSKGWKVWVMDPQFGCGYDFGCKEVQVVRRDQA